jgi:hypothetical protein
LAQGSTGEAAAIARRVATGASERGSRRYELFGRLLAARAEPGDEADTATDLAGLDAVAVLESWWLTADLAEAFGSVQWSIDARTRAERLVAVSGSYADGLRRWVERRLGPTPAP